MKTPVTGGPADEAATTSGDALVLHLNDNVATALCALEADNTVFPIGAATNGATRLLEPIALCHKFALRDIASGEPIIKYGESIGRANRSIRAGEHVHLHNLVSARGR